MTSKSEIKRLATLAPVEMAERLFKAEEKIANLAANCSNYRERAEMAEDAHMRLVDAMRVIQDERDTARRELEEAKDMLASAVESVTTWQEMHDRLAAENERLANLLKLVVRLNARWDDNGAFYKPSDVDPLKKAIQEALAGEGECDDCGGKDGSHG